MSLGNGKLFIGNKDACSSFTALSFEKPVETNPPPSVEYLEYPVMVKLSVIAMQKTFNSTCKRSKKYCS